jgi:hypothetical protein
MWEVGLLPSPVEFSSQCHFYKLSHSWLLGVCRCSCLLWPACLFTVPWGIAPPLPLWCLGCPALFATCLFCCYCLLYQFFFSFFPEWESVWPGGYTDLAQGCLWEYHVPLDSLCGPHLPKLSGRWHLAVALEPSWFLHLTWCGDAMCGLRVWRTQSFASSQWFFL